jgi:hypothetical protein
LYAPTDANQKTYPSESSFLQSSSGWKDIERLDGDRAVALRQQPQDVRTVTQVVRQTQTKFFSRFGPEIHAQKLSITRGGSDAVPL